MAPAKEFLCKKCSNIHKRPINSECAFMEDNNEASALSVNDIETSSVNDSNALNLHSIPVTA